MRATSTPSLLVVASCILLGVLGSSVLLAVNGVADPVARLTTVWGWKEESTGECGYSDRKRWHQDYCDHSGDSIYRVTFRDNTCTSRTSALRTMTGIESPLDGDIKSCNNPELSPIQPLGPWPPAGWFTTVTNIDVVKNALTSEPADGTRILPYQMEVMPLGECAPPTKTAKTFEPLLCSADGLSYGRVVYSDSACTNIVAARTRPTGRFGDTFKACPPNAPTLPSTLSSMVTFTRSDGVNECGHRESTTVYRPDGICRGGWRMQCVTNSTTGIQSVVTTRYKREGGPPCKVVDETNTYPVDTCVEAFRHGYYNRTKFSCPPPHQPSTAGE